MKLDQLEYFVATARRQHIGQAASALYISPSAISHSIAALEAELGKPLFIKHGRQIKLTTHGKILLDRAEFILAEVNRIQDELSTTQLKMKGHYRIAATHLLCSDFLTPTWINIQKENPELTSTLYTLRSGEVLTRVNSGELDLGFCFCPHSSPEHEQETIYTGKLLFYFGKNHPFLKTKNIKELAKYPAIASQAAQGIENCQNHPALQRMNIQPKVINLFDSYAVAIRAIQSNTVWAILPDIFLYEHHKSVEAYSPPGWDENYRIAAIWPKHHIRTQVLDYVIKKMEQNIKQAVPKLVS